MKKKTLRIILQYIIFLGLGIGLIMWQAHQFTDEQKSQIFSAINNVKKRAWLLIPVTIVGLISEVSRAMRWRLLLKTIGSKPSLINVTGAVMIGYLVNLLIPRMGEIARCTILARSEKTEVEKIVGTVVAERSFDMICLLIISILTVVLQMDVLGHYMKDQLGKINISAIHILGAIAILLLLIGILFFIYKRFKDSKVAGIIKGLSEGVRSIFKMQNRGLFLFHTVLIWFCYLLSVYIGFKGLTATDHLPFISSLAVLVFGSLGMIITPGGLGAYPAAVKIVLVNLYSISGVFALAYGWVSWMAQTFIIILFGLIALLVLPAYNRYYHGKTTVDKPQDI